MGYVVPSFLCRVQNASPMYYGDGSGVIRSTKSRRCNFSFPLTPEARLPLGAEGAAKAVAAVSAPPLWLWVLFGSNPLTGGRFLTLALLAYSTVCMSQPTF